MDWQGHKASRWAMRPLGIALLFMACAAGRRLLADGPAYAGHPFAITYLIALAGFLCFSAGGALLVHGHHLFDTIRISERWRRLPPDPPPARSANPPPGSADPAH